MILKNKIAIIHGGAGAVGSAVARTLAREGATVFILGRTLGKLDVIVNEIKKEGGKAEAIQLNALDKTSVENTLSSIYQRTSRIDISFNAIGISDVQGLPLSDMSDEDFFTPVEHAMRSQFITAVGAARYMRKNNSGVILAITADASVKPHGNAGGFGIACAAIEAFCRQLAIEEGQHGIRVVCIRSAGSPDAPGVDEAFRILAKKAGVTREAFETGFAQSTMLKRLPKLSEIAGLAAMVASDGASALTAAVINATCGELAD